MNLSFCRIPVCGTSFPTDANVYIVRADSVVIGYVAGRTEYPSGRPAWTCYAGPDGGDEIPTNLSTPARTRGAAAETLLEIYTAPRAT